MISSESDGDSLNAVPVAASGRGPFLPAGDSISRETRRLSARLPR